MSGRFFLLLVVVLCTATSGCASVAEERVARLESAVIDLQARDTRLATLEKTVEALVTGKRLQGSEKATGASLQTEPDHAPRRVSSDPSPSPPPVKLAPVKKASPAQVARQYQSALAALESGRPQAAMPLFQNFLVLHPETLLAANAGYWLGECYYTLKQYDAAISAFKDVVAQHPAHEKAAAAMLKAGYSYALLDDAVNAKFYLETLIRDFPSSQPAALARTRLASL